MPIVYKFIGAAYSGLIEYDNSILNYNLANDRFKIFYNLQKTI